HAAGVVLDRGLSDLHLARYDARRSAVPDQEGIGADTGQLPARALALQHGARGLQAVPRLFETARLPSAVSTFPDGRGAASARKRHGYRRRKGPLVWVERL